MGVPSQDGYQLRPRSRVGGGGGDLVLGIETV